MQTVVPAPWQLNGNGIVLLYKLPRRWVLEHGWLPNALRGAFVGGIAALMLVDYTASGVGPYREALFVPGQFRIAGRLRSVITRIVVSTQPSVDSGRANWGIPKELAGFTLWPDGMRASVGADLAVEATLEPFGPHLPVDTAWLPLPFELAQYEGGRRLITRPRGRGAVRLARLRQLAADQRHFPDLTAFRPLLAAQATGFTLTFPEATVSAVAK